jgi:ATP-dependent DNA helicase RecG
MPLPININALLHGRAVESERIEFKEGWNPEGILHAVCAFANDFHNWGGGYLVLGVKTENGKPILPPIGLQPEQADAWQRKLLELGHRLQPAYHPISEPATVDNRLVLVVWVPGGEMRPYKAPISLAGDNREWAYFIRLHANTVRARGEVEQELISLANRIPFDDRQNAAAPVSELKPNLIQSFLAEVKSDLQAEAASLPLEELGRRMQIVRGPFEAPRPLNVGLLFFTPEPAGWFPQTQIDIVHLPQGRGGNQIIEKTFKGPVGVMLRDALGYLRNNVVTQYVTKRSDRAEAERFYNVPYAALEEALVNAIYHRSYEEREPIEVQITPEEVTILSFPGPDRTVRMEDLRAGRAVTRRYRNRRIGEFLKELELSEGRGTGIPKILNAMRTNGSVEPIFETDDDRLSFLVRLPLRPAPPETAQVTPQVTPQVGTKSAPSRHQVEILRMCLTDRPLLDLLKLAGRSDRTKFRHQVLNPLLADRLIEMTIPDKPTSRLQKYRLTDKGRAWLAATDAHRK